MDSEESISLAHVAWPAITTNRIFVPARQAGNRFPGSLKGSQIRAQATQPSGIGSLESILGLLESLKIRALVILIITFFVLISVVGPKFGLDP